MTSRTNLDSAGPASLLRSPIRRALLSVYDKRGIVELATALVQHDCELLASGGTAQALQAAGLPVTPVDTYTGAPEILEGRVKTLHPKIAAGLLADRRHEAHMGQLASQGYAPIDLVVCNLYPFAQTVAAGQSQAAIIEMIDIGGPTLIRAAAKNHQGGVTVLVDPADYESVRIALSEGGLPASLRERLACRAFHKTAHYDAEIAAWFARVTAGSDAQGGPPVSSDDPLSAFVSHSTLRYGENPHQQARLLRERGTSSGVAYATQLVGKELSYNNYLDLDAAYRAVEPLALPACAVIKHNGPCGLAQSAAAVDAQADALVRALAADPVAAFGGVLGFNRALSGATAQKILDAKLFVECIIAPDFSDEARALLREKSSLRLLRAAAGSAQPSWQLHRIGGGLLWQQTDPGMTDGSDWRTVTQTPLQPGWLDQLRFAMHVVGTLRSNAIAITREGALIGSGAGQPSRIDAARIALSKAGEKARGAFLASDAFFPFADCVEAAAAVGVAAIAQPGGSLRDAESIAACDRYGIAMVFTGRRHFRH